MVVYVWAYITHLLTGVTKMEAKFLFNLYEVQRNTGVRHWAMLLANGKLVQWCNNSVEITPSKFVKQVNLSNPFCKHCGRALH